MSWQPPNSNWTGNGNPEDILRARLSARNGLGGQLSFNDQLTLQSQLGIGGTGLQTQNYSQSTAYHPQQSYTNQAFSQGLRQQQLALGLNGSSGTGNTPSAFQSQSLQFNSSAGGGVGGGAGGGAGGGYGRLNQLQTQSLGFNNPATATLPAANNYGTSVPQNNSAVFNAFHQQLLNLQQNALHGQFQNTGQSSVINNNIAQAVALAQHQQQQQQQQNANLRTAASLAGNPAALSQYLYRLQQQQNMLQNQRQSLGVGLQQHQQQQLTAAQILSQQAALQQGSQLQLQSQFQSNQQISPNMAALLKTGNAVGHQQLNENQMLSLGNNSNQGMNLAGFNSTGLANSELASAPLLPILGTDLAKPSQRSMTVGTVTSASELSAATQTTSSASPDTSSIQTATETSNALTTVMNGNETGTKNQTAVSPTSHQDEEVRKALSKTSLSSPAVASAAQPSMFQPQNVTSQVSSPSANSQKDRDLTTLKTLGQMLAKTGNSVESAVQNGLLGGCNAEDVKIVWEAYVMEFASIKQYDSANKTFQKTGAELVAKRAKSDDPMATKLLLEAAKAPTAMVPGNVTEALQCLGMDEGTKPPNPGFHQPNVNAPTQIENKVSAEAYDKEDGIDWDGIIENEHDYVPHNLIDEVNKGVSNIPNAPDPREEEFDAMSYGFFAGAGNNTSLEENALEENLLEDSALEDEENAEGRNTIGREGERTDNNITIAEEIESESGVQGGTSSETILPVADSDKGEFTSTTTATTSTTTSTSTTTNTNTNTNTINSAVNMTNTTTSAHVNNTILSSEEQVESVSDPTSTA